MSCDYDSTHSVTIVTSSTGRGGEGEGGVIVGGQGNGKGVRATDADNGLIYT